VCLKLQSDSIKMSRPTNLLNIESKRLITSRRSGVMLHWRIDASMLLSNSVHDRVTPTLPELRPTSNAPDKLAWKYSNIR